MTVIAYILYWACDFVDPSIVCAEGVAKGTSSESTFWVSFFYLIVRNWVACLALLVSFGTLIWRIFDAVTKRRSAKKERKKAYQKELMMEQAIQPVFLDSLREFIVDAAEILSEKILPLQGVNESIRSSTISRLKQEFSKNKNAIVDKALILMPILGSSYELIAQRLDSLEDKIVDYFAFQSGRISKEEAKIYDHSEAQRELYQAYGEVLQMVLEADLFD